MVLVGSRLDFLEEGDLPLQNAEFLFRHTKQNVDGRHFANSRPVP